MKSLSKKSTAITVVVGGVVVVCGIGALLLSAVRLPFTAASGNTDMRFYGRVIDQDGIGVGDVKVEGQYSASIIKEQLEHHAFTPHPVAVVTDKDGNFTLRQTGVTLTWDKLSKEGYLYASGRIRTYTYLSDAPPIFKPDPAHPEVFDVWKRGKSAKRLVGFIGSVSNVGTGEESVSINFGQSMIRTRKGHLDDADVIVSATHSEPSDSNAVNGLPSHYDWSFRFEVPSGGVQVTNAAYPYLAPDNGYEVVYEFRMRAEDANWASEKPLVLFIKSGSPPVYKAIYAGIRCSKPFRISELSVSGWKNPDGSRNLQP
jgi:hypothetical protein